MRNELWKACCSTAIYLLGSASFRHVRIKSEYFRTRYGLNNNPYDTYKHQRECPSLNIDSIYIKTYQVSCRFSAKFGLKSIIKVFRPNQNQNVCCVITFCRNVWKKSRNLSKLFSFFALLCQKAKSMTKFIKSAHFNGKKEKQTLS